MAAERRTAALLELAKSISGTLDLTELLARAERTAAAVLQCDIVATFCRDPRDDRVRMISQYGVPAVLLEAARAIDFPPGQPFGGRVMRGETVVINDMRAQGWVAPELYGPFGVQAILVVPLNMRGRDLGALLAVRTGASPAFENSDVELCQGVADHLAVAVEMADLYQRQQDETQVAAAAARVGQELISSLDTPVLLENLCRLTTDVLECDCAQTLLLDPQTDVLSAVTGFGFPPEMWESMRTLSVSRDMMPGRAEELWHSVVAEHRERLTAVAAEQFGITAAVCVPLRRATELTGVLVAAYRGRPGRFSESQLRIARAIGQLASMAMENARLVEELQQASRLKSEFVATMSHELRTPLNVIIGYTDLLLEASFGALNSEQLDVARRVERNAQELLELINATLDLGRLEAGRLPLEIRATRIEEVVGTIDGELREMREKPGLTFTWAVAPGLPRLRTDPLKLKVILKNLITNAIKFTPAGRVVVDIRPDGDGIQMSVSDTGIGIAEDALGFIFEPFRQADSSTSRRYGGVGLGLHIVRRLLDVLGGTISVESTLDSGSTFRVFLPRNAPC